MPGILCIDIGGTRIKAAVINQEIKNLDELAIIKPSVINSLGWLNQTLPEILSKDHWASLVQLDASFGDFKSVSVGIPDKVDNGMIDSSGHLAKEHGVPKNLGERLHKITGRPVRIVNDARAWAEGILKYHNLAGKELSFPAACLTFGTGVGFSILESKNTIRDVEINHIQCNFTNLRRFNGKPISHAYEVHNLIGKLFFKEIEEKKEHWRLSYDDIRSKYSERVAAFLKDIQPWLKKEHSSFKKLYVGGGFAGYVSIRKIKSENNIIAVPLTYKELNINTDLIPLIGLAEAENKGD